MEFGGHQLAAGLRLRRDRIDGFRALINRNADGTLDPSLLTPTLQIDAEVGPEEMNSDFARQLDLLAPYGAGNPKPLFCLRDMRLAGKPVVLKAASEATHTLSRTLSVGKMPWVSRSSGT